MHNKVLSVVLALALARSVAIASIPDDNVVIEYATDEYTFQRGDKGIAIKNIQSTEYRATRRAENIQPNVFHNNRIILNKASGGKAQYRNINSPTVFHDDSKVCFFNIVLDRKDKKAKTRFERTFIDGAHFTGVFLEEEYPVTEKQVIFQIPDWLPDIKLVDRNFPDSGIERLENTFPDGSRVITYTIRSMPGLPKDKKTPSALISRPHIMVKGYFPDCDSLYRYHQPLLDVDTVIPEGNAIIAEATNGATGHDAIISAIYRYVQQNIRYVAFEEGEAAYRPDSPAEVLRKRYGDCKGMSLLLATLLQRCGIEAYIACVGTDEIPFRIAEVPSLSAANHMICIVPEQEDSYLFLDPTHHQISSRHIPQWICGKDAMMFTPDGYRMIDIPATSPLASENRIEYHYRLTEEGLTGKVSLTATEDMAEHFVISYSEVPGQHLNELLTKALIPGQRAQIHPDSIEYISDIPGRVTVSAPVINTEALIVADNMAYLDLNTSGDPFSERIDTDSRKSDYLFSGTGIVTRRATVALPTGSKVTLPSDYHAATPQAEFSCTFRQEGNTVSMTKTLNLQKRLLPLKEIPAWNKALAEWKDACNQQIEIETIVP